MSAVTDSEVAECRSAVGRTLVRQERLSAEALRRFALAIGAPTDVERGQPVLAHWAYFLDAAPDDELSEDGHPRRGGFLPNIALAPGACSLAPTSPCTPRWSWRSPPK